MRIIHVWTLGNGTNPLGNKFTGLTTIQAGVAFAQPGDTIRVYGDCQGGARCVYREHVVVPIQLRLEGIDYPIIDGGDAGRCVDLTSGSRRPSVLTGFEVRHGRVSDAGAGVRVVDTAAELTRNCIHHNRAEEAGGGVYVDCGTHHKPVTIAENILHDNRAGTDGGGIAVYSPDPQRRRPVTISTNVIGPANDAAVNGGGVAIYRARAALRDNEVVGNRASGPRGTGGGVHVHGGRGSLITFYSALSSYPADQVVLERNHLHGNEANEDGGAVAVEWTGSAVLEHNLIAHNRAITDDAGGVYATVKAQVTMGRGNDVLDNTASSNGGGFHVTCKSALRFGGDNRVVGNRATSGSGGGISVRTSDLVAHGPVVIAGNQCGGNGGGVWALTEDHPFYWEPCEDDCLVDLDGVLIEDNLAGERGGAIAIHKQTDDGPKPTTIARCVIRRNRSTNTLHAGISIWLDAGGPTGYAPRITGTLVEGHTGTPIGAGVYLKAWPRMRFAPELRADVFLSNDEAVKLYWADAVISRSYFKGQRRVQIDAATGLWQIFENELLGGGATRFGVVADQRRGVVVGCNIEGHAGHGVTETQGAFAPGNWWGQPVGPTEDFPGGQAGGDKVTRGVFWRPPSRQRFPLNLDATGPTVTPSAPTAAPPTRPTLSELFGGFDCFGAGRAEEPRRARPTPPPPPPPGDRGERPAVALRGDLRPAWSALTAVVVDPAVDERPARVEPVVAQVRFLVGDRLARDVTEEFLAQAATGGAAVVTIVVDGWPTLRLTPRAALSDGDFAWDGLAIQRRADAGEVEVVMPPPLARWACELRLLVDLERLQPDAAPIAVEYRRDHGAGPRDGVVTLTDLEVEHPTPIGRVSVELGPRHACVVVRDFRGGQVALAAPPPDAAA